MDVGVRQFRGELRLWLERVKAGEEIVITERGIPVARLIGVESRPALQRLIDAGVVRRPSRPARPIRPDRLIRARGSVSDLVAEQRR